jgi:8-oxo-dGTP pyrophosphatase MutT (NUDIX family)
MKLPNPAVGVSSPQYSRKGIKLIREFSSGGVVFKKEKDQVLWLIRKTTASKIFPKQYWMLPKGWIDDIKGDLPGPMASGKVKADPESLEKTAVREVAEETGVEAKIQRKIGTSVYSYDNPERGKILKFATFFLMEFVKDLPEGFDFETSEVAWLPYEEAHKTLSFGGEKQILTKAKKILASVAQRIE